MFPSKKINEFSRGSSDQDRRIYQDLKDVVRIYLYYTAYQTDQPMLVKIYFYLN